MPPKRSHDNVDPVDGEGEGGEDEEDEVVRIRIVNSNTENGDQFMCEMCSSVLKSAASLSRHKMSIHGSEMIIMIINNK